MKNVIKKSIGFTLIELMIVVAVMGVVFAIIIPIYKDYKESNCSNFELKKCYYTENSNPFKGENKICVMEKKEKYIKVKKYVDGKETTESGTCREFLEYNVEK